MATTVVLADDHAVVRHGLRSLLAGEPGLRVVGEAADGLEAARLIEQLEPDVAVVDLMMPGLNGIGVVHRCARRSPSTRVVILSIYSSIAHVAAALEAGATGYVLKESTAADLVRAVRESAAGRRYLSPPLTEESVEAFRRRTVSGGLDLYSTLTSREREVLHLAAEGLSSTQIGARLGISPRTAETHRANLMEKLGLRNHTELVRYALQHGLLPSEPDPLGPGDPGTGGLS